MADAPLTVILRTLQYQADHKPGKKFMAQLQRGLVIELERSRSTKNYRMRCGRKRVYSGVPELEIVVVNWPQRLHLPVEWKPDAEPAEKKEIHWMCAILKPLEEENHESTEARVG